MIHLISSTVFCEGGSLSCDYIIMIVIVVDEDGNNNDVLFVVVVIITLHSFREPPGELR